MPKQGSCFWVVLPSQPGRKVGQEVVGFQRRSMLPGCCGVWSCRLACNFSLSPGHRLCGFTTQSTAFTPLPGSPLRALGLSAFPCSTVSRAGRGCLSPPGGRQAPLHILLLLLFALTNCRGPSGSSVPSALRGGGPCAQASSLSPGSFCPSFLSSRPSPCPNPLMLRVRLLSCFSHPCLQLSQGWKSHWLLLSHQQPHPIPPLAVSL